MCTKHMIKQTLTQYLQPLGFSDEAINLYAVLTQNGPLSFLAAARASGIERTKLYRLSETLRQKGLIEEIVGHKKKLIKAANPNKIYLMIKELRSNAETLQNSFSCFTNLVNSLASSPPTTKVLYYNGKEGLKQILWNELNAQTEILTYDYTVIQEASSKQFFDNWADEFEIKGLKMRELRGNTFLKTMTLNYPRRYIKNASWRYIPPEIFDITHQLDIYNDVLAIFNWYQGEVFGVEIHNQKIADSQKQIFEMFWQLAKPFSAKILKSPLLKKAYSNVVPKDLA